MSRFETTIVFTAKSVDRILSEGGTSSWRLDRNHARLCEYAVCTRNAYADWVEGQEAHHAAFLVGRIKDVVPSHETEGRWLITFSEYARVDEPNIWKGDRNPVKYAPTAAVGIDFSSLDWQPMPATDREASPAHDRADRAAPPAGSDEIRPLTMAEAKRGLAATFGVTPEAVEITIRG